MISISQLISGRFGLVLAVGLAVGACDEDKPVTQTFTYDFEPVASVNVGAELVNHGSCDRCDANAVCAFREEAVTCVCKAGFSGDGLACSDVDECAANRCSANATCTNSEGGFDCTCKAGFVGDGVTCNDLNECRDPELNDCGDNAFCVNALGSYACECNRGFSGQNGANCTDINECADADLNDCADNATCANRPGGFTCACLGGFSGDGRTCTDIDECATEGDNCNVNAACTNTDGGFRCDCNEGFEGNGVTCDEVDGCDNDPCDPNASCTNNNGSPDCDCNEGYEGNGLSCSEINACLTNPCDANATCTSALGLASCDCNDGFEGSGLVCTEINGCFVNPCDVNATCTSTLGVASCDCNEGFEGSGLVCTPEGPLCTAEQERCDNACINPLTSNDHCGECDNACSADDACAFGTCVTEGNLRVSVGWSRSGDLDLFVTTPNGNTIYWDNLGPDAGTDFGFVETDASTGTGPENIAWAAERTPPTGLYFVCVKAWNFTPDASTANPVDFTAIAAAGGDTIAIFTGTLTEEGYDDDTCDILSEGYVGAFIFPPGPI